MRSAVSLLTNFNVLMGRCCASIGTSVALASIQSDLHGGVSALQWVVGAYALTFASLMLAFGMLGDKFGRKKIMLAGAGNEDELIY